ncbi:phytanoyl-CoA hydroxylase [Rhodoferax ferrireducens]|uniref:Phytanoyl-CoA hydroxylase n=1 Tax=Rhodoferax ferrireducens TaxID=192843 RepID=A0ABU2CAX1_9BURK|nr:phytanoyl-CoA dioxygenase family protein [Rhodoferax ferrireducens]MDR7378465.1 phytanoyl-CoA hydroxylase [Rhodoferax ferrireducens]
MVYRCRFDEALGLSIEARTAYARDGVLVLEDFVPAAQCQGLQQRALELVAEHAPQAPGTVFSARDQRYAKDAYFENSARGIGAFFEAGAFDAQGRLCVPLERAINKLGHAMHDLDPVFQAFSHGARLQAVADGVGLGDAKLVQSMYIFKQPGIGGEVNCHQDATYLYTEPQSVVGFWFAIEDAHRGNGCLGGLLGGQRGGLKQVFRRQAGGALQLEPLQADLRWDMEALEWLEVRQGTLIVFNGLFPHLSEPNHSAQSRHAYTLHAVSGQATYPASNWIQPGGMPFTGFV